MSGLEFSQGPCKVTDGYGLSCLWVEGYMNLSAGKLQNGKVARIFGKEFDSQRSEVHPKAKLSQIQECMAVLPGQQEAKMDQNGWALTPRKVKGHGKTARPISDPHHILAACLILHYWSM